MSKVLAVLYLIFSIVFTLSYFFGVIDIGLYLGQLIVLGFCYLFIILDNKMEDKKCK